MPYTPSGYLSDGEWYDREARIEAWEAGAERRAAEYARAVAYSLPKVAGPPIGLKVRLADGRMGRVASHPILGSVIVEVPTEPDEWWGCLEYAHVPVADIRPAEHDALGQREVEA